MRFGLRPTPEVCVLAALLALSILGLVFMNALVAQPKLLFGRALSALAPSLFPSIVMAALALLCALLLFILGVKDNSEKRSGLDRQEWLRGVIFFAILTFYALTMQPFGFLISTAIVVAMLGVMMGNRSVIQGVLMSLVAPVLLYLAATRLLAVSLPELNAIELAYARLLGG